MKEKNSKPVSVGPRPRTVEAVFSSQLHMDRGASLLDVALALISPFCQSLSLPYRNSKGASFSTHGIKMTLPILFCKACS